MARGELSYVLIPGTVVRAAVVVSDPLGFFLEMVPSSLRRKVQFILQSVKANITIPRGLYLASRTKYIRGSRGAHSYISITDM
jgi:hypothetical protein